jgi:hypothetical protein
MPDQAKQTATLLPPDEKFWQRYSPHHELPVSGMTSLFLHGAVIGVFLIVGVLVGMRWHGEAGKPPSMDVVMLEGGGDGSEGLGGPAGLPGDDEAALTELTPRDPAAPALPKIDSPMLQLENAPSVELALPSSEIRPETKDLFTDIERLAKEAAAAAPKAAKAPSGTGNPKGVGGKGGLGNAPGPGKGKKGLGTGFGGLGGKLTKAQIFARRWGFDLSGTAKDHADKLAIVGIHLAVVDARGDAWFIRDLTRRPAEIYKADPRIFMDAVYWENKEAKSIFGLARELNLPFVPQKLLMLLPKEREQSMANAEALYAKEHGRDFDRIISTEFDFRLRGNTYEPVVKRMQ